MKAARGTASRAAADGLPDAQRLARLGDVVDAHHLDPLPHAPQHGGDGTWQPRLGRALPGDMADEALARDAEQDRTAEAVEEREIGEDREVVLHELAEADAGIDRDPVARDAGRLACRDARREMIVDLGRRVCVDGLFLHRLGIALAVHQDHRDAKARDRGECLVVMGQRGDVVDDARTLADGKLHHPRLAGVDGNDGIRLGLSERLDHRQGAHQFLFVADGIGTGAGRFPADIEESGARRDLLPGTGERLFGAGVVAAVGKAVGGDVDHSHDARFVHGDARECVGKSTAHAATRQDPAVRTGPGGAQ